MIIDFNPVAGQYPGLGTRGSGEMAYYMEDQVRKNWNHFNTPHTSGGHTRDLLNSLTEVFWECADQNWDGHGAAPITLQTVCNACRLIETLPVHLAQAEIAPEPDGQLAFEWHHNSKRTLSVSVSPDGDLHFAALLGARKIYGTEPFTGSLPKTIADLIKQIQPA